ncbi:LysR family transcriptional regulator [Paraliomyxa miuraensis]|uniref:LysR family transcriptional regulator n=1 Tax=Paraliomyxa miuraensis TaxID=376150 RepID=UPI002258EB3E|nr:LysR family transcriptional regulator [Paraliomyxa miuraensis]MCX4240601.1 LysR family transcriptional regulator [Paraliomyxa miuraensis]
MQLASELAKTLRWDDLKVLLALHRRGSLKQAAQELGVNISTISRRLAALEELLGAQLFDRTPDGVMPTAAAEQLVPHAEEMEQAAVGFVHGLEGFEVEPEGVVRITAPPGLVDHFLAPALVELLQTHPRLRIQIVASIGYADLTRREADLALRLMRPAAGDFVATRLVSTGWCVLGSPAHAEALGELRDPAATRWITWGEDLAHLPDARWLATHVERERVVLETSSMTAQIEAVRTGLGVMVAPLAYAGLRDLVAVPCGKELAASLAALPEGSLWLVGHRALRQVPRIAAVWSWLRQQFEVALAQKPSQ